MRVNVIFSNRSHLQALFVFSARKSSHSKNIFLAKSTIDKIGQ